MNESIVFSIDIDSFFSMDVRLAQKLFFKHKILRLKSDREIMTGELLRAGYVFGDVYRNSQGKQFFVDGDNRVMRVCSSHAEAKPRGLFGNFHLNWHNDFAHSPGDYHGTCLYNKKNGDIVCTKFIDMCAFYESLPSHMVKLLSDKSGYHRPHYNAYVDYNLSEAEHRLLRMKKYKIQGTFNHDCIHDFPCERPLIVTHPISGKKSLYISPATIDMSRLEFNLNELIALAHDYIFEYKWDKNDVLIFDNLSLMHSRPGFRGERELYRIQFDYRRSIL